MIFHEFNNHFMNIGFENWVYMILGAGAIILLIIVFSYVFIYYNSISKSRNQQINDPLNSKRIKSEESNINEVDSSKKNFCYKCGQKLNDREIKFCPYCGERV
jgi:hypothetical protein